MGRIADALRRAEQERQAAGGPGLILEGPPLRRTPIRPEDGSVPTNGGDGADATSEADGRERPSHAAQGSPSSAGQGGLTPALSESDGSAADAAVVPGMAEALIPYYDPSSLISEQYRSLRTRLLSGNPNYEHRILAITSGAPKDGKSVTTLNLGCTLAEIRHLKVLVVDGDFRRSSLGRMLNMPDTPGLAEVLRGEATYQEVLRRTPIPNLLFIPSGSTKDRSAAELLTTKATRQAFARMKNDFHYTVVDTPPATTVSDAGIIGQMCNGVIVLVRMNRTHEALAKRAVKLLQSNNVPIMGCLAIGREAATGGYGYGYGYYYNRHYYDYYKKGTAKN